MQNIVQFIKSRFPKSDFIPLHEPKFVGNEISYLTNTIESTFVSSVGEYVNRFEEMISKISSTSKGIAVVNGTAGLQVGLKSVGVEKGSEVLTQSLTFVATANSIAYNGAEPVFIDVDLETMSLSPDSLLNFLEENTEIREDGTYNKRTSKKISACVVMHTFGFMANMERLEDICSKWKIPLVEDAAEALGSSYKGKPAGSIGKIGVFSFNGNKIVTCGGGGAIVTNNESLAKKIKHITTTAKVDHSWEYYHDEIGYNFRLPNLNAALACAQLENLDKMISEKQKLYQEYAEYFNRIDIKLRKPPKETSWNYWLISLEFKDSKQRDDFLRVSNTKGIMTRPIWKLMHRLPMYKDCQRDNQLNSKYLEDRIVNIPSSARFL